MTIFLLLQLANQYTVPGHNGCDYFLPALEADDGG
jgi:hypothetical protein